MTDPKAEELGEKMQQAVSRVIGEVYPGDLVTRFVVVAESLDGESSNRAIITATAPQATTWDLLGLLGYAYERERAAASIGVGEDG